MTAKERARIKIIEFIGNPENEFPTRTQMAKMACGYKDKHYLYKVFTVDELAQIEKEGLEIRRKKYTRFIADVDRAVFKAASEGDVQAAKLAYQRFEGWSEKRSVNLNGKVNYDVTGAKQKLLDRIALICKQDAKRRLVRETNPTG